MFVESGPNSQTEVRSRNLKNLRKDPRDPRDNRGFVNCLLNPLFKFFAHCAGHCLLIRIDVRLDVRLVKLCVSLASSS